MEQRLTLKHGAVHIALSSGWVSATRRSVTVLGRRDLTQRPNTSPACVELTSLSPLSRSCTSREDWGRLALAVVYLLEPGICAGLAHTAVRTLVHSESWCFGTPLFASPHAHDSSRDLTLGWATVCNSNRSMLPAMVRGLKSLACIIPLSKQFGYASAFRLFTWTN